MEIDFKIPNHTVVVGLQFGDEGKGKIVDALADNFAAVCRYQGGGNAGHTIYRSDGPVVLHHLPCSVLHLNKLAILGNGMVIDPQKFLKEISRIPGIQQENIKVSKYAHITDFKHVEADMGGSEVGSTKRGIGPTYADKFKRTGRRAEDCEELTPFVCDTRKLLNDLDVQGESILFEGAQGALLDIDFGTYPYVTSSSTTFLGVGPGTGFSPRKISRVIGVAKCYMTRVGDGPFHTEDESVREILAEIGIEEKGATTNRERKVGWLDLVALRYACELNDVDEICLTKTDAFARHPKIKVCTEYNGVNAIEPHYETVDIQDLPNLVSAHTGVPVTIISNGPKKEDLVWIG